MSHMSPTSWMRDLWISRDSFRVRRLGDRVPRKSQVASEWHCGFRIERRGQLPIEFLRRLGLVLETRRIQVAAESQVLREVIDDVCRTFAGFDVGVVGGFDLVEQLARVLTPQRR